MDFESVRAYLQLASGLGDLTRTRARQAAQGLLSLPAAGMATGTKMASQASVLADELLAAAAANRSNLQTLVRSEVNSAIARAGLVPVQKLEEAQAEAAELRQEVATLRSGSSEAAPRRSAATQRTVKQAAPASRASAKKAAPTESAPKTAAKKAGPTHRSAVTTRSRPVSP